MFASLSPIEEKQSEVTDVSIESFEDLWIESLEHSIEVKQLQSEIKDLISTATELEQLYSTIEKNGITTSLMSFANKDNVLSANISNIPSLEALVADIPVDDSKAALEGIADVLKTIYEKTIGKITSLIGRVITSIKIKFRSIPAMRLRIDTYVRDISGKEFNVDKAHKVIGKFSKYEQLLELITHASNANKVTLELLRMELPKTEDEFVKFKAEIEQFKKKYEGDYRITDNGFKYTVHSEASLIDNGYTAESFHAISSKLDEFIRIVLSSETELMNEWNGYEDKVDKILEDLSATYKDGDGQKQTAYTKGGHMLMEAAEIVSDLSIDVYFRSYRDGPIRALKTLSNLKKAYA